MATNPFPFLTPQRYLEMEREAEFRSEYIDGRAYAMSGGSRNHSWVIANTLGTLFEQLRGKRCGATSSDMRLYSEEFGIYTYPDIVVTCPPEQFLDNHKDTITDAVVVVEVLSPSTKNYDRGEKFRFYRSLPSFAEYLILAQDTVRAEHHVKQANGSWLFHEYRSPEDELELESIGCRLILGRLYERVEFESAEIPYRG